MATFSDTGSVAAYVATSPERSAEVRDLLLGIAADLASDGVTDREWEVAGGYLEGSLLLGLDESSSVMARLGNHVCARDRVTPIEEQVARLRAVTPSDVAAAAARVLAADPVRCGVGPLAEADLGD